jgi:hypothetical protein
MTQVPGDAVSFFGIDAHEQSVWFGQDVPVDEGDGDIDVS